MAYDIPLFDLNFDSNEEKAVVETIKSRWISTGPKCDEFERKFADEIGVPYALSTSSCTSALHLAINILGIKSNDEVLVPSLTFVATANAITYVGAKPVFCDIIGKDNLTIDPNEIVKKINRKTKAILVMHYAGFPCRMDTIMDIAKAHNLKVIEDAAHSPLSEFHGKKLGAIGHIGCFSFFSNKNISTGEGGMLVTHDEELFNKAKILRSHGMTTLSFQRSTGHATNYDVVKIGYNYRLDDIRASIGITQLKKVKADILKRKDIRQNYIEKLNPIKDKITIPFIDHLEMASNYIFPIVLLNSNLERREKIRSKLHSCGIQTSVHYPAIHRFTCYAKPTISLPQTEYVSDNEITLPFYAKLETEQISFICDRLIEIL